MQQHSRYAVLDLVELEPFPGNARRRDLKPLVNSIKAHGQFRTLVVREQDQPERPKYQILAGHGTADALKACGISQARCEILFCTDEEALAINLADNRTNDLAFYDEDALAAQLEEVRDLDLWDATGWDRKAADKYLNPKKEKDELEDQPASYGVIVTCYSEEQQAELLERFSEEGLQVRALMG